MEMIITQGMWKDKLEDGRPMTLVDPNRIDKVKGKTNMTLQQLVQEMKDRNQWGKIVNYIVR